MHKNPVRNSSKLFFLPENTSGRLYDNNGVSRMMISRDSVYLLVDNSCPDEAGLVVESGEVVYFDREKIFLIK